MVLLSINVNKFALIRNARGTNHPDLVDISNQCIKFGAQGITVHPRPDERHVKFSDLQSLSKLIKSQDKKIEFNIEGYPSDRFCNTINEVKPDQVTLVPDPPGALTSSFGWDCFKYKNLLKEIVKDFQNNGIRVSLFIDPSLKTLEHLASILPNRVELHTFNYAKNYSEDPQKAIHTYKQVTEYIKTIPDIFINAGHDLNLDNLNFLLKEIQEIKEVSIGHALVCDAFNFGLENTVKRYLSITSL